MSHLLLIMQVSWKIEHCTQADRNEIVLRHVILTCLPGLIRKLPTTYTTATVGPTVKSSGAAVGLNMAILRPRDFVTSRSRDSLHGQVDETSKLWFRCDLIQEIGVATVMLLGVNSDEPMPALICDALEYFGSEIHNGGCQIRSCCSLCPKSDRNMIVPCASGPI